VAALDAAPEHRDVERVAVAGERARHHAVVDRERQVVDLAPAAVIAVALPVQPAVAIVDLELAGRAARDLDHGVDAGAVVGGIAARVVPPAGDGVVVDGERRRRDRRTADHSAPRDIGTRQQRERCQAIHMLSGHRHRITRRRDRDQDTISDIWQPRPPRALDRFQMSETRGGRLDSTRCRAGLHGG
jgi:hypothetical protein